MRLCFINLLIMIFELGDQLVNIRGKKKKTAVILLNDMKENAE